MNESVTTRAMEAAERLNVRSALNPALWLCAIVALPSMVAAALMNNAPAWLIALSVGPVAMTCIGYLILLFKDPDKLQSENYQLRKHALQVIEEKGGPLIAFNAHDIQLISNPDMLTVENKGQ